MSLYPNIVSKFQTLELHAYVVKRTRESKIKIQPETYSENNAQVYGAWKFFVLEKLAQFSKCIIPPSFHKIESKAVNIVGNPIPAQFT